MIKKKRGHYDLIVVKKCSRDNVASTEGVCIYEGLPIGPTVQDLQSLLSSCETFRGEVCLELYT